MLGKKERRSRSPLRVYIHTHTPMIEAYITNKILFALHYTVAVVSIFFILLVNRYANMSTFVF